jgi:small subunit ribosomal protein S14
MGDTRPCRIKNRCVISGGSAGVYRDFRFDDNDDYANVRLGRQKFRELALDGELPGVQKGSW